VKIVDITEFYSERGGGIRSHLTDRACYLSLHDHRHLVIASGPRDEMTRVEGPHAGLGESRIMRLAGPPQPYDRTYHLLHRFRPIRQRVRAERPDVLEAHSPYLAAAAVVASGRDVARLKTAFWHSDHLGVYVESHVSRVLGARCVPAAVRPFRRAIRTLLAPFDATFAAGRAQAERLRAAGVRRVVHVPFGVDKQTFRPEAGSEACRRAWLGDAEADAGTALLIGAGRFAREKRWDVVLDAFARVSARRKARLVLFGDGPERAHLERAAPPGVRFPGFERDRARFARALASADLLIHAAPYETFGLSLAEAVACGLPVVVPDAGGAADHAVPGASAKYPSLDVAACAASIEQLLDRPRHELRARAAEAAARAPSRDDHFRQVLATYEALLEELGR